MRARTEFAREHRWWNVNNWSLVVFSDESDFFPVRSGKLRHWSELMKFYPLIPYRFNFQKLILLRYGDV